MNWHSGFGKGSGIVISASGTPPLIMFSTSAATITTRLIISYKYYHYIDELLQCMGYSQDDGLIKEK